MQLLPFLICSRLLRLLLQLSVILLTILLSIILLNGCTAQSRYYQILKLGSSPYQLVNIVLIIFIMHIIESYKALFTRKFFLGLGLVFGQKIVLPSRKLFPEFEKFPVSLRFIASNISLAPTIKGISSPGNPAYMAISPAVLEKNQFN